MKTANQIRQEFIDYFVERGHTFVKSSPVVPHDDPTLLFTNAGMNQFKAIFLGESREGLSRAVNSQKCMRVSGKHNDLEEVGRDHHHHTFFEMLGNWSFGDYYKKEAIVWAWELLTGVWNLPKDKLYATVYLDDDEAEGYWRECTDIDPAHISRSDENFWEMGDTGPCGPCSELHIDRGAGHCVYEDDDGHSCEVNAEGCGRFVELWNLVFMQNSRGADGAVSELPKKNIDTGMGFERVLAVMQDVKSNYDTDAFRPIIDALADMSGKRYSHGPAGTPFRVIADHIRALVFAITDGAVPSNEGRGYVLRRLLRRAYRFGRELGFREPFLYRLAPVVVDMMGAAFVEISERLDHVAQVIRSEEERFGQTLEQGIERFAQMVESARERGLEELPGADVFALYDTFGFPMDLTRLMAGEQGFAIDEQGFDSLMHEQRQRAREAARRGQDTGLSAEGWTELERIDETEFTGYEKDVDSVRIARYKVTRGGDADATLRAALVILDRSPFYAESGGQVGDAGELVCAGGRRLRVDDAFKWNDMSVLKVSAERDFPVAELAEPFEARIDVEARDQTRRNHSATHLLQAALRDVLGEHVQQSGSRVAPDSLRFDFTHFSSIGQDALAAIERAVNGWILRDHPVETVVRSQEEAKQDGAIALFGEKYGANVRVVSMGPVSKELCGGTHVTRTGQIGLFHITGESSIAAGVRRIEATTGFNSLELLSRKERLVADIASTLKASEDALVSRISELMARAKDLEGQVQRLSREQAGQEVDKLFAEASQSGGAFPWTAVDLGRISKDQFGSLTDAVSDAIRQRADLAATVVALAADVDGKAMFSALAGKRAVSEHTVNCGELVKAAASKARGGGGGSPVRAQAGGKSPENIGEALEALRAILRKKAEG
jgi:alanyl-tRNA synthetase